MIAMLHQPFNNTILGTHIGHRNLEASIIQGRKELVWHSMWQICPPREVYAISVVRFQRRSSQCIQGHAVSEVFYPLHWDGFAFHLHLRDTVSGAFDIADR